jgi:hypothetical protein
MDSIMILLRRKDNHWPRDATMSGPTIQWWWERAVAKWLSTWKASDPASCLNPEDVMF